MRFKKLLATLLAVLMMFSTSIPVLSAFAATNTVETVAGYHRFKILGQHDAYCITTEQLSSTKSLTNSDAEKYYKKYWEPLTATKKENIELAITAAHLLGYYDDKGIEWLGVQRYIWTQTNPTYVKGMKVVKDDLAHEQYTKIVAKVAELKNAKNMYFVGTGKIPDGLNYYTYTIKPNEAAYTGYWKLDKITGTNSGKLSYKRSGTSAKFTLSDTSVQTVKATAYMKPTISWYGNTTSSNMYRSDDQGIVYLGTPMTMPSKKLSITYNYEEPEHVGYITVKKINNKSGNVVPSKDIKFHIKNSAGITMDTLTTNSSGVAQSDALSLGTATSAKFTVVEDCPDDYVPADGKYSHTVTVYKDQTTYVTTSGSTNNQYVNTEKMGDFLVHKKINGLDDNGKVTTDYTSENASGFKFQIKNNDEPSKVYTSTTDSEGNAYFCNVPLGKYTLSEIQTNDNYVLSNSENEQTIEIVWDGNTKYTEYGTNNKEQYKQIKHAVFDELTYINETGVEVSNGDTGDSSYTGEGEEDQYGEEVLDTSDDEWTETGDDIVDDSYSDTDSIIDDEYTYNDDTDYTVDEDTANMLYFDYYNTIKQWRISLKKVDSQITNGSQGHATLEGAEYGLYRNDELVDTYTTDSEGKFTTDYYSVLGSYYVQEITPSKGYKLDTNKYPVFTEGVTNVSEWGALTTLNTLEQVDNDLLPEDCIEGKISVLKFDADYPDNKLSGAEFTVYDDTNENGQYDTDEPEITKLDETETGYYVSEDLPYGHYLVRETKAPEGFNTDNNYYSVFIEEDGKTYSVKNDSKGFMNTAVKGYIDVLKFDKDYPDNKLKGAEFTVYDDTNANGKYDKGESAVTKLTEKNVGYYKSGLLRYGHYLVRETKAPKGTSR